MRLLALMLFGSAAFAQGTTSLDWVRIWSESSRQRVEQERTEKRDAQKTAAQSNAAELSARYAEMAAALQHLAESMDNFGVKYNNAKGQVVLLREQRLINESVTHLVEAWKQLKRCEAWGFK